MCRRRIKAQRWSSVDRFEQAAYLFNRRKGELNLKFRDNLYDPLNADISIPDVESIDVDCCSNIEVSVKNEVLHLKYELDEEDFGYDPDDIIFRIPVYNSYWVGNDILFYIHYAKVTGIQEVSKNEDSAVKGIYSVTGIKLKNQKKDLPPGLYIMDGKKIVIP